MVDRRVYAEVPPRVEYRLTELGSSLIPALVGLHEWAEQFGRGREIGARSSSGEPRKKRGGAARAKQVYDTAVCVGRGFRLACLLLP